MKKRTCALTETQVRLKENAFAFEVKRKGVSDQTQGRFTANVLAFFYGF